MHSGEHMSEPGNVKVQGDVNVTGVPKKKNVTGETDVSCPLMKAIVSSANCGFNSLVNSRWPDYLAVPGT